MKLIKCTNCKGMGWVHIKEGYWGATNCPVCGGAGFIEEPEQIRNPVGWVDR